jgi:sugar porter (SP) family MFS transporter
MFRKILSPYLRSSSEFLTFCILGTDAHLPYSSASWRIPLGLQIVPALVLAIGIPFFPFSPRWLMANGRESEAMAVLAKIRSSSKRDILIEYNEIKQEIDQEREQSIRSYSQLFRFPLRRRLILGIGIQTLQQLTGITSVMYYAPEIFKQAGLSGQRATLLATGINGCVNVLATIPAILYLDKWGRRPVLISGAILMSISMLTIGSIMGVHGHTLFNSTTSTTEVIIPSQAASYTMIVFVYVFVASFAFSWGPTTWLYCAEIFPLSMRAKGTSLTTAAIWATNCLVSFLVPLLLERITYGTYLIFGNLCFCMAIIAFLFYPETKGRSLEDMDLVFGSSLLAISSRKKKKHVDYGHTNNMLEFKKQKNAIEKQSHSSIATLDSYRVTYL